MKNETKPNHKKHNKMKLLNRIEKSVNERLFNVLDEIDTIIKHLKTKKQES